MKIDNYAEKDALYAEYIMANCHGDRLICNGDSLICAMESNYLLDEFEAWLESIDNLSEQGK